VGEAQRSSVVPNWKAGLGDIEGEEWGSAPDRAPAADNCARVILRVVVVPAPLALPAVAATPPLQRRWTKL